MAFVLKVLNPMDMAPFLARIVDPQHHFGLRYVVDEDRGIYLLDLGQTSKAWESDPVDPAYWNLLWGRHTIALTEQPSVIRDGDDFNYIFDVIALDIPRKADLNVENILGVLRDAIPLKITSYSSIRIIMSATVEWTDRKPATRPLIRRIKQINQRTQRV